MSTYTNSKQKLRPLIIIGAGGHAVSIANVALSSGYEIAHFVDKNKRESILLGIKIISDISDLTDVSEFVFSIAVGQNFNRQRIYNELTEKYKNLTFPALVHPSSVISHFAKIDNGTVVMPNAIIGPNSVVGKFCILNTQSSIDHDCVMSDFSSLSPKAVTGGSVKIGFRSAISIGAVVKHNTKIGDDSILGSNSYLNKDLHSNCVAYGTPAKVIRNREIDESYL